ncbi:MAG: hypothetical protein JHD04_08580 [Nocardioides sp.]|nr:hypothetical protein [Nocardioides sp.]
MTGDESPAETSERLAAWLERLGLADQLGAAGLPTLHRDGDGHARWTDPRTGEPLGADQLADLDRLLHAEGDEPEHAVPVPLVQLAQQARVRAELVASPWHDYASLAALRGATLEATRFDVHKAAGDHRLLVVSREQAMVPAFQLDAAGRVRDELAAVLTTLLEAGTDPWRAWAWLTRPAALLGGLVPEQAAADPETTDLVRHVAVRLAERATATG